MQSLEKIRAENIVELVKILETKRGTTVPGFCESCVSGQHADCRNPECRCLCRKEVQKMMQSGPIARQTSPIMGTMVCPGCSKVPRVGDQFCRADGTKLISGKMCRCGKSAEPDDKFCGGCGRLFGPAAVPVPELNEEQAAALEAAARQRPSDVETPPIEVH